MATKDVVAVLAEEYEISQAKAKRFYQGVLIEIREALLEVGRFALPGVGVLKVVGRKARTGTNPKTGKPINIAAKKTLRIKIADEMKRRLNSEVQAYTGR